MAAAAFRSARPPPSWRKSKRRAATAPPALPRCITWGRLCATAAPPPIREKTQAAGGNGAACHAQMYTMGTLLRHGSAEQKARYLPGIARGELRLQAFAVTEPTSGTDTLSLRTTATRAGDHYVVDGQKIWTSRAEHSDLMLLLARTTPRV